MEFTVTEAVVWLISISVRETGQNQQVECFPGSGNN